MNIGYIKGITADKSIEFPKKVNKDVEIIRIDEDTYYDLTNGIGYKIIKRY